MGLSGRTKRMTMHGWTGVWLWGSVYERRQRRAHPVCTFFRPSCVQKTSLTNESEVSSPSNRRISAYVWVVVLGVLRRAVSWAGKSALP